MTQVLVRYKIKPEHAAENERLVRAVYDELQRTEPGGFHYATFQLDDGVTFVHLASTESHDGQTPLGKLDAFRRFQENIGDRCDEPPVVTQLREIGVLPPLRRPGQVLNEPAPGAVPAPGAGHAVQWRPSRTGISRSLPVGRQRGIHPRGRNLAHRFCSGSDGFRPERGS